MQTQFSLRLLSELIFPSLCLLCSHPAETKMPLCSRCLEKLEWLRDNCCQICGLGFAPTSPAHLCGKCQLKPPSYHLARAVVKFEEPAVEIVHRFKYQREFAFLAWMSDEMARVYQEQFAPLDFDLIIPVPLHWQRLLKRGYNQSQLLARFLAKKINLPLASSVLVRTQNTPPQVGLSRNQREKNLKKAFLVKKPSWIQGKKVLLIDDVITTGATIQEASKTLKRAGAELVGVLAFARA